MELYEFAGKYSYDGLILYLWNYYSYNNKEQSILSILIWFSIWHFSLLCTAKKEKNVVFPVCQSLPFILFNLNIQKEWHETNMVQDIHSYKNESLGLTMKPIIIKLKSWRYGQNVWWNRSRRFENGKKKPGENSFSVSLDLTKQSYNLLKLTQGIMKEMDNVSFVCADVNCFLAIGFKNGTIKHFNSEHEFRLLLNDN